MAIPCSGDATLANWSDDGRSYTAITLTADGGSFPVLRRSIPYLTCAPLEPNGISSHL